jgi:RNA polymerase sigma-70 factor (ECF subfamily)
MSTLVAAWPLPRTRDAAVCRATDLPMDPNASDTELVLRIAQQDREAFRLFYDRYAGRLLGYVRQISREREVSEDVVQDVFLAVWRKAASFKPDRGDVPGWLYTITRNRVVDRWRRKGGLVEDDGFDLVALEAPERGDDGHATDISVRQALGALTPDQRQAIELAYFGGLTYEETARKLDLPLGTLKSRIRAGLARMRGVLDPAATA